jgi:hypothetical protein
LNAQTCRPVLGALFWLTYRHPDSRAAGVVVIELAAFSMLVSTTSSPGAR